MESANSLHQAEFLKDTMKSLKVNRILSGQERILPLLPLEQPYIAAADTLQASWNLQAEIIDLRFLNPLNYQPLIESVKKTGKVVLVSDACERGSFLNTIASHLTRYAFDYLDAPPAVIGSRNWITPAAEMEDLFFPQPEWIIDAVHELILPLDGHRCTTNQSIMESIRRNRLGV